MDPTYKFIHICHIGQIDIVSFTSILLIASFILIVLTTIQLSTFITLTTL